MMKKRKERKPDKNLINEKFYLLVWKSPFEMLLGLLGILISKHNTSIFCIIHFMSRERS
jgi:hypothetical protein